ncbi:MAG: aspartate 1-decarboxylase [Candidatus Altiarchaeota archaeon]
MMRTLLKSKIHNATVTGTNTDYVGSITIDKKLIKECGLCVHEKVLVSDLTNGSRFETYVVEGGDGVVEVNGAASKLVKKGDRVIIMAFGVFEEKEVKGHKPRIIVVGKNNRVS